MQIFLCFRRCIGLIMALFVVLGISPVTQTHDVKDPGNCKMNFSVVSDVHMEVISLDNDNDRVDNVKQDFVNILQDIKNNKTATDAVVFLGDNTMNGDLFESLLFYGLIETVKPAKKVYTVMGNHDTGNGHNEFDKKSKIFWDNYNAFTGSNVKPPYYYYEKLDNCYFIFTGTESDTSGNPDISLEQIQWLDSVLSSADADGLPAFVFNHHPPFSIYENREEFIDVIEKHHDVFLMTGHTHTARLTVRDFDEDSHYFNISKVTDRLPEGVNNDTGLGLQVEIYDSKVTIRGRRFAASEWLNYEFNYDI